MFGNRGIRSLAFLAVCAGIALPSLAEYDPLRKGAGERRTKLTAMERKPFDWTLLSKLSDWKNGPAPTAQSLDGKVVLIVTYSDWYRPAARALSIARKMAETYSKDGLVVIAAHNPEGWKDAAKPEAPAGATMLLSVDEKGELRKALLSSQDPNFYMVDRAGQLRFADIANESVDESVKFLIGEKREDAASINQREAEALKTKKMQEAKTAALNSQNDILRNIPELPFPQPSEQAYKDAKWPAMPQERQGSEQAEPKKITLPSTNWAPSQPALAGRAMLLYFWNPNLPATYEQMQKMADILQRQHARDLVVVGVLTELQVFGTQTSDHMTEEERAKKTLTPDKAVLKIKEFQEARKYDHSFVVDLPGSVLKSVTPRGEIPLPFVTVVSSDGMTRWWGFVGSPEAQGALDRVLEVDPGIQARRKVEADYMKSIKKDDSGAAPAGGTPPPGK